MFVRIASCHFIATSCHVIIVIVVRVVEFCVNVICVFVHVHGLHVSSKSYHYYLYLAAVVLVLAPRAGLASGQICGPIP